MKIQKFVLALGLMLSLSTFNDLYAQDRSNPTPAPLPDDSLSFCRKQMWAKTCLNVLLTYRCSQYYYPFNPLKANFCSNAASSMINHLDYKTVQVINDNKIYRFKIIFTNQLKTLINTPSVQTYLTNLSVDLKEAMAFHHPFDLYQYTLKFAKDRDTAVLWLGILFQDTTFSIVQVQYLEDLEAQGKLSFKEKNMKKLMKEIAIMLEPKKLVNEDYKSWLKLYPEFGNTDLNSFLNPSFYHFYPIALMASHLRKSFWTKEYATIVPFALNSDYEFQTLDSDNWPWRHPDPFEITAKLEWKMRDIYTGLAASLFGAKKEKLLPEYTPFTFDFAAHPFQTMKEWAFK